MRGSGRFKDAGRRAVRRPCLNPLHCGAVVASKGSRPPTTIGFACLNPLHCGAVVASREAAEERAKAEAKSQSPSLRGSGRFKRPPRRKAGGQGGLNPLHCGAVVASPDRNPRQAPGQVSIPFIAGQWSLQRSPAHCGAGRDRVSIPFIAGQWSLPEARAAQEARGAGVSIPFIAGQWSLHGGTRGGPRPIRSVSIPFIAGQWSLPADPGPRADQTP